MAQLNSTRQFQPRTVLDENGHPMPVAVLTGAERAHNIVLTSGTRAVSSRLDSVFVRIHNTIENHPVQFFVSDSADAPPAGFIYPFILAGDSYEDIGLPDNRANFLHFISAGAGQVRVTEY